MLLIVNGFGFLLLCKEKDDREMALLATTDSLTGLVNRRAFFERTDAARMLAARLRKPISLMMLDIDHFKSLNDRFGHACGDEALCVFAATSLACCASTTSWAAWAARNSRWRCRAPTWPAPCRRPSGCAEAVEARGPAEARLCDDGQHRRGADRSERSTSTRRWRVPTMRCTRPRAAGATASRCGEPQLKFA